MTSLYKTPDGFDDLYINAQDEYLTGVWFQNSKDEKKHSISEEIESQIIQETKRWLDLYFSGVHPDFMPKVKINNLTSFRKEVLDLLVQIPYGQVVTYNDIAKQIANNRGIEKMSAQAVGQAVGWNPIGILIPCHRVIATDKSITGYGGGIQNKIKLLELEGYTDFRR